jgi:FkbM family methyltransferase
MLNQLSDPLEGVLASLESQEEAASRQIGPFDSLAQGASCAVIFGCGHLGKRAFSGVVKTAFNVVAFADNNPSNWGKTLEGIPIVSPAEAVAKHNDEAFFLVAIYNGTAPRQQLRDLGCKRIVPFPLFVWHFPSFFPDAGLELPHRILESLSDVRRGYEVLSDLKSREEFAAQIHWRCTLDYGCLPAPDPSIDTYYPPDLIHLTPQEVLVDCGAFDGDSIRMFLERTGNSFHHIYAVEPDPKNRAALKSNLSVLPGNQSDRISILPYGVGSRNETVFFNVTGTAGSRITATSDTASIECRKLDDLLEGPEPTFIKMDVEGAEPFAIEGATETIRRARPILAVCAYHKCEHLWTLPVLMKAALPEYQIFLRRYAEECWEMVYYAIPPERRSG